MIYKVNLKLEAIVPHLPLYSMGLPVDNFRIFFRDAARVVGSRDRISWICANEFIWHII